MPSWGRAGFQGLEAFFMVSRSLRSQIDRRPEDDTMIPLCCNSQLARFWPKAGFSIANSITARSTCSGTRFLRIGFLRLRSISASSPPCS